MSSRRDFLKGATSLAVTTLASGVTLYTMGGEARAQNAAKTPRWGLLIDATKCTADCNACVDACGKAYGWHRENYSATDSQWIRKVNVSNEESGASFSAPVMCQHCTNPPCVKLCPWGAARQLKNGISRIDSDICLGGSKCKAVCPWDVPQRQTGTGLYLDLLPSFAGNGVMYKCDRCYDRVTQGEVPACIDACPEDVQTIGPRYEIIKKAHEIAEEINGYVYGETENGGTNTIYVSPVAFEELNKAIEKGKGKPHLAAAADAMAQGNNLAAAMLIAPLAGAAAAVGKYIKHAKKGEQAE